MNWIANANAVFIQISVNNIGEIGAILTEIKLITEKIQDEEESGAIGGEWKFATMVQDRLCLVFFSIFTFVVTLDVLAVAPHKTVYYIYTLLNSSI